MHIFLCLNGSGCRFPSIRYGDRTVSICPDDCQRTAIVGSTGAGVVGFLRAGIGGAKCQQLAASHGDAQAAVGIAFHDAVFAHDLHGDIDNVAAAFLRGQENVELSGCGGKAGASQLSPVSAIGHSGEGSRGRTWF